MPREIARVPWEPTALLEALDESVCVLTRDGIFVYVNPSGERLTGKTRAELIGRSFWDLYADADDEFARAIRTVSATGTAQVCDTYYGGWGRWHRSRLYLLDDHVYIIALDITEQRHAELRLRALARASHTFSRVLEIDQVFESIARCVAELVGDGCVVRTIDGDHLRTVALHHPDPELHDIYRTALAAPLRVDEGLSASVFMTGEPFLVDRIDVAAHRNTFHEHSFRDYVDRIGVHSVVAVALYDGAARIGVVTLCRDRTPRPYTRDDLTLLQDLTERASMAVTRARLYSQSQRDRQRALALATASRAFSAAEGDMRAVLDLLARAAVAEVGEVCVANVISADGTTLQPVAFHANGELTTDIQDLLSAETPIAGSVTERIIATGQPLRVANIDVESLATRTTNELAGLVRFQPRAFVMIPIKRGERILGTLTASRQTSKAPYSDADVSLLEELADRAAIALENARVLDAQRVARQAAERVAEQTRRLQAIGSQLSHRRTAREVAETILRDGCSVLGNANGGIWLLDRSGTLLEMLASVAYPDPARFATLPLTDEIPLAKAVLAARPVFLANIEEYTRQFPVSAARLGTHAPREFATVCLPLVSEGRAIGGLALSFPGARTFTADERTFLEVLASQCAQAIDRARLLEQERAASAASADTSRRLNAVIHASPAAIIIVDQGGIVRLWNPAAERVFGWTAAETIGKRMPAVPADRREEFETSVARVTRGEEVRGFETRALRRDGVEVDVALWAAPIVRPDGEIQGLAVFIDITDRKRAEEIARLADRRKDEFLAMLGHELRNPLAPIMTALDLMRIRGETGAESERATIERQTKHLVRLVDDLLDISRITRGKLELRKHRIDLGVVIASAVEMASPLLEQRSHHVSIVAPRGLVYVDGDEFRLAQVFQNLLTNAAKYTPSGGSITVRLSVRDEHAMAEIEDNGEGISGDVLPTIFDPFVQGTRKLERSQGGLGIGLTLVRSLTELHGGRVQAHSDGPGRGSRFTIRLPLSVLVSRDTDGLAAGARPLRGGRRRVLLVDDNQDAAEMLGALLRAAGHEVIVAFDGPSALGAVPSFAPEVALLDIGLPVMDGYDLARRLKTLLPAMPRLIAITGYGQEHDHLRSQEAGFAAHLVKPVQAAQLLAAVDELVD